jgi:hypothetical protein
MNLHVSEYFRYGLGIALEVGVCGLALRRGLYLRLRLFTVYLCAVVITEFVRWVPILLYGPHSSQMFWAYWDTQFILVLLRGAVVFEIAGQILRPYPGVWRICKGGLCAAALVLVTTALVPPEQRGPYVMRLVMTGERGMELAIVGILLVALVFCRYYRISVDRLNGLVALGLGLYSAIQLANNTFQNHWPLAYESVWKEVRVASFAVSILIWAAALWKPLPDVQRVPNLLGAEVYSTLAAVVNVRLRELNARLEEMLR